LELGAGYGEFSKSIQSAHKWALDQNPALIEHWGDAITPLIQQALAPLPLASGTIGTVFASNFFEHFTLDEGREILSEAWRVLRPAGRLIVVQPNFRLEPRRYFDDYTHKAIYTDNGFKDFLKSQGWRITHVEPRFTPFSMKSRLPTSEWLVSLYLASPVRPMAGQFLVVAERGDQ
jgi:SAM-dependent methyltransferase